jgi:hypothetical protein
MRIERRCPFCFVGKIFFESEGAVPHAGHTNPPCKAFNDADDALAFIVAVNKALGNTETRGKS